MFTHICSEAWIHSPFLHLFYSSICTGAVSSFAALRSWVQIGKQKGPLCVDVPCVQPADTSNVSYLIVGTVRGSVASFALS